MTYAQVERASEQEDRQQGVERVHKEGGSTLEVGSAPCGEEGPISRDLGISGLLVGRSQSAGMRVTCIPWLPEALSLQGSGSWHVLSKSESLAKLVCYPQPS